MTTLTDQPRGHPRPGRAVAAAGLTLALGLTACTTDTHPGASGGPSSATGAGGPNATAGALGAPTTINTFESDIVLAGRTFRARCYGSGPTIIDVADYGLSMDDTEPLRYVAPQGQLCFYDRLGEGQSNPARHLQTFASLADDLDGVISGLGLTRPVVVIGDAFGAPIALTWASRHEKDARALVLLTPPPPGFMGPHGALSRLLPPRNPGDLQLSSIWSDQDHMNTPSLNRERLDPRSWDAYLRLPPTSTPLYDLATQTPPSLAPIDAKKANDAWWQGQSRVLRLSSSSHLVDITSNPDWATDIQRALERVLPAEATPGGSRAT